ncbi:RMI1 [Symbiodinium sp. KB8]|nr:RMI1 [Symbiodinium sp. KB8]
MDPRGIQDEFRAQGCQVSFEWIAQCVKLLAAEGTSPEAAQEAVFEQLLLHDIRDWSDGSLPPDAHALHKEVLADKHILQIDEVLNIGAKAAEAQEDVGRRCLKLALCDGQQQVTGIEYRPMPEVSVKTAAGAKLLVQGVTVRRGVWLLHAGNCKLLGGSVPNLEHLQGAVAEAHVVREEAVHRQQRRDLAAEAAVAAGVPSAERVRPSHAAGGVNRASAHTTPPPPPPEPQRHQPSAGHDDWEEPCEEDEAIARQLFEEDARGPSPPPAPAADTEAEWEAAAVQAALQAEAAAAAAAAGGEQVRRPVPESATAQGAEVTPQCPRKRPRSPASGKSWGSPEVLEIFEAGGEGGGSPPPSSPPSSAVLDVSVNLAAVASPPSWTRGGSAAATAAAAAVAVSPPKRRRHHSSLVHGLQTVAIETERVEGHAPAHTTTSSVQLESVDASQASAVGGAFDYGEETQAATSATATSSQAGAARHATQAPAPGQATGQEAPTKVMAPPQRFPTRRSMPPEAVSVGEAVTRQQPGATLTLRCVCTAVLGSLAYKTGYALTIRLADETGALRVQLQPALLQRCLGADAAALTAALADRSAEGKAARSDAKSRVRGLASMLSAFVGTAQLEWVGGRWCTGAMTVTFDKALVALRNGANGPSSTR